MKTVILKPEFKGAEKNSGTLVESYDDIVIVKKELDRASEAVIRKFISCDEPFDRLGHVVSGFVGFEYMLAFSAVSFAQINESNPIYQVDDSKKRYLNTLNKMNFSGRAVFINKNCGMKFVSETDILELKDWDGWKRESKYYLDENSKVINFENDFELEREAIDYMETRWGSYSYIKDMRMMSKFHFKQKLKQFVEQGGAYVYVYTTGMDVDQMYAYSTWSYEAGLRNFIFKFNAGLDDEINKFLDWLKKRKNINVEIV